MAIPIAVFGCDRASARWHVAQITSGGAPRAAHDSATHAIRASHDSPDLPMHHRSAIFPRAVLSALRAGSRAAEW